MKKKSKLSKRITWRVILIMAFFNVFIIGAIVFFALVVSEIQSTALAKNIIDGINGKLVKSKGLIQPPLLGTVHILGQEH